MTPPSTSSTATAGKIEPAAASATEVDADADEIVAQPDAFGVPAARQTGLPAVAATSPEGAADGGRTSLARLVDPVRRGWRVLTSMRTALILLFLLAVAAIPGSLLPQNNINPILVQRYRANHPTLGPIFERLSLFHVFSAPWFAAIYVLLFISLIGCLWSRVRWHAQALLGRPPAAPARPGRLAGGSAFASPLAPGEATAAAAAMLRSRRFRVAIAAEGATRPDGSPDHSVAAEKGYLRETGNLVFHIALMVLLLGVGLGSWYGYQGSMLVVQGDGFSNTLLSYDQFTAGAMVNTADLRPYSVTLDKFSASYQLNGEPKEFAAAVSYSTGLDSPVKKTVIKPNHPLEIGKDKVYLLGHGYAPHFVLRDKAGKVVWESYVTCAQEDPNFRSLCVVKIPDAGLAPLGKLQTPQQLAFTGFFTPTTIADPAQGLVSIYPAAANPAITLTGYVGNLHVNEGIPQNIYSLDTRDMKQFTSDGPSGNGVISQALWIGQTDERTMTNLPGGLSLSVDGVREYAQFQVKSDPTKDLVLVAAIAIILGLIISLRVRRRRVWVRARAASAGSTVEIGGLSRSDAEGFAAELASLTTQLRAATTATQSTTAPDAARPDAAARDVATSAAVTRDAATPAAATPAAARPDGARPDGAPSTTDENAPSSSRREP
ncbi:cytochrome c biogenesis protein ResB [Frankia sp. AgB1.9]|uniref:cytochrome c biogenesis protein ResB n=1 Tax=unclassified Frankia TaxID=2632575 RepID=UPI001932B70B|nr:MULTISPECIES: cytochrome c biogenesis protein ResB [unclassified Frankia]MBL7488449.1 cytochrome c biogenesis protein ResB [Frankia sp. AgW1.1]MBL7550139.1 cytochrome c biogenesis protein ResB [Frankia sp. AgB1.9]MBL7625010.1 cytochrome c biogenesis protein ResB [Frankia sp. AgB1.8]